MKNNEQLFDDFLQRQVEEADLPYKGEYWEKMSSLLDNEEKKKRFPFWRGLSLLLIVAAVGVATYLGLTSNKTTSAHKIIHTQENTNITQSEMLPSANKDQILSTLTKDNIEENISKSNDIKVTNTNNNFNAPASTSETHSNSKGNHKELTTNTAANNQLNTASEKTHATEKSASQNNHHLVASNTSEASSTNIQETSASTNKDETPTVKKSENKVNKTKARNDIAEKKKERKTKKNDAATAVNKNDVLNSFISANNPDNIASNNIAPKKGKTLEPIDTVRYTKRVARDESIYNPRYNASLLNYIPEKLDSITLITYKSKEQTNTIAPLPTTNLNEEKSYEKRKRTLMMLVGMNANQGFKTETADPMSWGFSPFVGVGFDQPIGRKFMLSSHLGFTYYNGLNATKTVTSYQYGFGLDSSSFQVAHKKLLQLYLPVSIYYQVLKNHALLASIGLSYTPDVSSKITETTLSNNTGYTGTAAKTPTQNTTTQTGYRTGFNQYDVFAQIGYAYTFRHNMTAQIVYQQGFLDATKNSYFSNSLSNKQTRISLGIKYNFKRK